MVFPWPAARRRGAGRKVRELIARGARDRLARSTTARSRRTAGSATTSSASSASAGLCGLYVDEKYGGQGLSQTGYARVFETFAQIDATLSIVLGVHQSIGFKGIALFGTDEQKERFLPDLAAGRKLAGFALTEPEAGSDAYEIESRAVAAARRLVGAERREALHRQRLQGRRSSPPSRAREVDGKDRHIALILEKGMKGFEVGERFDTMGLRGNDLRRLYFNDVRVPPENVLGEPGDGFKIAMHDPQQRPHRPRHRLGRRRQEAARPRRSTTSRSAASSASRSPTSSWSRTRSAGWSPTCSGWSRWRT